MTALAIAPKLERFFVRGAISARATLPLVRDSWSGVLAITIDASLCPLAPHKSGPEGRRANGLTLLRYELREYRMTGYARASVRPFGRRPSRGDRGAAA
ncbi:MAG: hypothetical protein ACOYOM_00830 [Chloroflexota bacterium]